MLDEYKIHLQLFRLVKFIYLFVCLFFFSIRKFVNYEFHNNTIIIIHIHFAQFSYRLNFFHYKYLYIVQDLTFVKFKIFSFNIYSTTVRSIFIVIIFFIVCNWIAIVDESLSIFLYFCLLKNVRNIQLFEEFHKNFGTHLIG